MIKGCDNWSQTWMRWSIPLGEALGKESFRWREQSTAEWAIKQLEQNRWRVGWPRRARLCCRSWQGVWILKLVNIISASWRLSVVKLSEELASLFLPGDLSGLLMIRYFIDYKLRFLSYILHLWTWDVRMSRLSVIIYLTPFVFPGGK